MGTIELKTNLHKILDKIEDEQLLRTIYDFLKQSENAEEGQIWKTLTEEQKKAVYLSYEESQDDKNLIDWKTVGEQVFVTPRAERNFDSIVKYIKDKWGEGTARQFVQKTDELFKLLKNYPSIGQAEKGAA